MRNPSFLRPGVTLVEVLVALVILTIAALGSAAALGLAARLQHRAAAQRVALEHARLHMTRLELAACTSPPNGLVEEDGVEVRWTATARRMLTVLAVTAEHRGAQVTLGSEVWCP